MNALLAQSQVGRFEVRDFLGRGAIGDVFLAWDPGEGREVALKVVRARRTDPDMLEAEKNGIALQQQLAAVAPQVAAVYGWGDEGDLFWVAMEYVDGRDLAQVLDEGPLAEERAIPIALQLCEMLEACHGFTAELGGRQAFGIVHGDIKPENVRLQERPGEPERVRVLDFGIAKQLSQTRRFTRNLFGSLPYTPPERLDRGEVDRHSDLWALGVILYLMVCGELPFSGDDVEEVERKIRNGSPPAPLPGSCPKGLQAIVHRSLAFDPADRYASAEALRADLEAYRQKLPLPSERGPSPADLSATRRTTAPLSLAAAPTPAAPSDPPAPLDATRRTGRADLGLAYDPSLAATRRTAEPGAETPPPAPPPVPFEAAPAGGGGFLANLSRKRALRGFAFAAGLGFLAASQVWVRSEAKAIRHDLVTQTAPDVDSLYSRYRAASRLSLLSLGGVREELRAALVKSADRIADSYHGDSPSTSESGWKAAHDRYQAAIELDDGDRPIRAKLHYCSGHLLRIAAQTLRAKGSVKAGGEKMKDAVAEFREAAQLAPNWPDPYLGLARVYSYETFDFGELQKALEGLQQRSYPTGKRETAMLADGHRMRAAELAAQAEALRDHEQELPFLEEARNRLEDSLALYGQIPGYANSKSNRNKAVAQLETVNARLEELDAW